MKKTGILSFVKQNVLRVIEELFRQNHPTKLLFIQNPVFIPVTKNTKGNIVDLYPLTQTNRSDPAATAVTGGPLVVAQ